MKKNFAKSVVALALTLAMFVGTASAATKPNLPPLDKEPDPAPTVEALLGGLIDIVMDPFDPFDRWIP